jgi:hypothetical protein
VLGGPVIRTIRIDPEMAHLEGSAHLSRSAEFATFAVRTAFAQLLLPQWEQCWQSATRQGSLAWQVPLTKGAPP